jgi:hypothetical protein
MNVSTRRPRLRGGEFTRRYATERHGLGQCPRVETRGYHHFVATRQGESCGFHFEHGRLSACRLRFIRRWLPRRPTSAGQFEINGSLVYAPALGADIAAEGFLAAHAGASSQYHHYARKAGERAAGLGRPAEDRARETLAACMRRIGNTAASSVSTPGATRGDGTTPR